MPLASRYSSDAHTATRIWPRQPNDTLYDSNGLPFSPGRLWQLILWVGPTSQLLPVAPATKVTTHRRSKMLTYLTFEGGRPKKRNRDPLSFAGVSTQRHQ